MKLEEPGLMTAGHAQDLGSTLQSRAVFKQGSDMIRFVFYQNNMAAVRQIELKRKQTGSQDIIT